MVIARAKYRYAGAADTAEPTIVTAPLPPQILPRALATHSLLAHILSDKFCDGLPFHRQECMA
jgi:transposase